MNKVLYHNQVLNHQPLGYKADTLDAAPRHCTDLPKFQDIQLNNKVMTIFINILSSLSLPEKKRDYAFVKASC